MTVMVMRMPPPLLLQPRPVLLERPTKSPPRPRAARGARSGSALHLASPPAPSPGPRALQVTRRRIPALPAAWATAATATTGAPAATQPQESGERPSRCVRGAGRGRGPHESSNPDPGSETQPSLGLLLSGFLASPGWGRGEGSRGSPGLTEEIPPDLRRRRDPTRATLGTPGRDRRKHARGDGDPPAGSGSVCLLVHLTAGWAATAQRLRGSPTRRSAAPEISWSGAFKERSGTPRETGALNSGASPLIVQTQFLYESAANRELWLDICG
ncbi:PREDICTED: uncharacterized protein LOC105806520 [Propithecus coquereli]|uniref:uncharacterized protein LOC105806520 n=1 Tax=Propithecus coquereli TaxID=379532 RepID=UPI00063F7217|nr:PREDICTED: uncharacterized protein LOC105806520 [Propithecus coquereli]